MIKGDLFEIRMNWLDYFMKYYVSNLDKKNIPQ